MAKYGISYNKNYVNEVKIHSGNCRFTRNASKSGKIKWKFSDNLDEAVVIANTLCNRNNKWRYAQCCMRRSGYIYQCMKCDKLTWGKRLVNKKVISVMIFVPLLLLVLPHIPIYAQLVHYDPIMNHINMWGMVFAFLTLVFGIPGYYYAHPKRCPRCKTKYFA